VVTGNLKHEAPPDPAGAADLWRRLAGLAPQQPVWIAGSTHRGEESAVLDAHAAARSVRPDLALVIAPRHPERVGEVISLVTARGFVAIRRSELPGRALDPAATVIVLDTVGELAQLYSIADVVFVGGSLAPFGGHNMLEPATRAKPVLFGPHTTNFRDAAALLLDSGGARLVHDSRELGAELLRLLNDPDLRARCGEAGHAAVAARHGAVGLTLDLIARYLHAEAAA
jgi:3-deoxy-D-manno-octulosonic-acid transferase